MSFCREFARCVSVFSALTKGETGRQETRMDLEGAILARKKPLRPDLVAGGFEGL